MYPSTHLTQAVARERQADLLQAASRSRRSATPNRRLVRLPARRLLRRPSMARL